jgi:hypothetical protein
MLLLPSWADLSIVLSRLIQYGRTLHQRSDQFLALFFDAFEAALKTIDKPRSQEIHEFASGYFLLSQYL